MKTSNKRISFVSIVLAFVLILTACAGGNNAGSESAKPSESAKGTDASATPKEEPKETLKPYEVSIVYLDIPQKDEVAVEQKLNEYLKDKINATIDLRPIDPSSYKQKTELMINTGEKFDLIFSGSSQGFWSNVTKGAYLELDELLDKYGQGIKDNLHPLYLEGPRYKGKLYAIPTNKEITQGKALVFRKDLVDKYAIDYQSINSMADLEPWLKLMKEKEPDILGQYVWSNNPMDYLMYETNSDYREVGPVPSVGGTQVPLFLMDFKAADMKVKTVLDPEIVAINKKEYELYRSYYKSGYINEDAAISKTPYVQIMRQGKIWSNRSSYKPGTEIQQHIASQQKYEWVAKQLAEPLVTTEKVTSAQMSISRTSGDPARAMMVLNYLHTDPYVINLIVNGIEGTHYKKVGDNRIELIPDSGYATAINWVLGNQMINYLRPGEPDDIYEQFKKYNDEVTRFPLLGFYFDDTNVKNELSQLNAIVAEYVTISTGAVDNPSKMLDERNEKLKKAGIEKVQAEMQKQIDEWVTANKK